jgi:hypothetical protein
VLGIDEEYSPTFQRKSSAAIDLELHLETCSTSRLDKDDKHKMYQIIKRRMEADKVDVKNMYVPDYLVCRITDELM